MKHISRIFKALSDPFRLRIVLLLMERDLCVCELMRVLQIEQSRLSHQLRVLRDAGLIEDRRDGRWIIYSLSAGVRDGLVRPLMEFAGSEVNGSRAVLQDLERLDLCLRENVRKKSDMDMHQPEG